MNSLTLANMWLIELSPLLNYPKSCDIWFEYSLVKLAYLTKSLQPNKKLYTWRFSRRIGQVLPVKTLNVCRQRSQLSHGGLETTSIWEVGWLVEMCYSYY